MKIRGYSPTVSGEDLLTLPRLGRVSEELTVNKKDRPYSCRQAPSMSFSPGPAICRYANAANASCRRPHRIACLVRRQKRMVVDGRTGLHLTIHMLEQQARCSDIPVPHRVVWETHSHRCLILLSLSNLLLLRDLVDLNRLKCILCELILWDV